MVGQFPVRMFRWAAIYGFVVLIPLYALPLPRENPETMLGFIGVAVVFQAVFWIIGGDPVRYRALMMPAIFEKLVFAVPALGLFALGRSQPTLAGFAAIDIALAIGFWRARVLTPQTA